MGNHVHINVNYEGTKLSPQRFMYPFFTPFWYQEKAEQEVNKDSFIKNNPLKSGYFAINRTAFPYGQIVDDALAAKMNSLSDTEEMKSKDSKNEGEIKSAESTRQLVNGWADENYVQIKNYVPQNALLNDVADLLTKDSISKITINTEIDAGTGGSKYKGETLQTIPYYFNTDFRDAVMANNGKIKGVAISISQ